MLKKESGFTLIEVLIASALMAGVALSMASLITGQMKDTRGLVEKMVQVELARTLSSTQLFNSTDCTGALVGLKFQDPAVSSNDQTVDLQGPLKSGSNVLIAVDGKHPASPLSSSAFVSRIYLSDFSGSGTQFTARLNVLLDSTKLVRSLKPASIPVSLTVNGGGPPYTVASCSVSSSGSGLASPVPTVSCAEVNDSQITDPIQFCGTPTVLTACSTVFNTQTEQFKSDCTPSAPVFGETDPTVPISCAATAGSHKKVDPLFGCATAKALTICTARHPTGKWDHPGHSLWCTQNLLSGSLGSATDPIQCTVNVGNGPGVGPIFSCNSPTKQVVCSGLFINGGWSTYPRCAPVRPYP